MNIDDLRALLRSANLNVEGQQLKLRTIPTDNWLIDRVVFVTHDVVIEETVRTEMLVFADSVERSLPAYVVSDIVKLGMDTFRHLHGLVIHVIPNTIVTLRGDSFERVVKNPRQPFEVKRMHLNNPYLVDFLKGIRNEDGSVAKAA